MRELLERIEGNWEKVSGGWPSNDPPVYEKKTAKGVARLAKKGAYYFLTLGKQEKKLSRKATFPSADKALMTMLGGAR